MTARALRVFGGRGTPGHGACLVCRPQPPHNHQIPPPVPAAHPTSCATVPDRAPSPPLDEHIPAETPELEPHPTAPAPCSWRRLASSCLFGFPAPAQERAYHLWKRRRVALLSSVALCAKAALVLLPASAVWLHVLLHMHGAAAATVLALTAAWAAAGQLPAVVRAARPAAYARHHDTLWALSSLASASIITCVPAFQALASFQLPGIMFRNMVMPALMVYLVLPLLLQLPPAWQLLASAAHSVNITVSVAMAAQGSFPIGTAGHAVLIAASVGIACVMEARSRAGWLRISSEPPAVPADALLPAAAAAAAVGTAGAPPAGEPSSRKGT